MSVPRPQRSSYHQKALQQIRNSIQPFATCDTGSISSGISSISSSAGGGPAPPSPSYSPNITHNTSSPSGPGPNARGIEYRAQQYPFVPSQVPPSVQQLLRRIDAPSSASSSTSSSPTSQLQSISKKPTLVIKSTVVPKPVLQTALPYALPAPQPPFIDATPPPLPPKPAKRLGVHRTDSDRSVTASPASSHVSSQNNDPYMSNNTNLPPYTNDKRFEPTPTPPPRPSSAYTPPTANSTTPDPHPLANGNCLTPNGVAHETKPPAPLPPPSTRARALESLTRAMKFGSSSTKSAKHEENSINNKARPPPPPVPAENHNHQHQNGQNCDFNDNNIEQQPNEEIHTHESPIPERKKLSREKEEERYESKVRVYSPQAFKFFMEQHVENVIKSHQERMHRRMQLESEMVKIGLSDEAQTQMRKMLSQKESNYIRLKRAKMDKSLFKQIRVIGVGAFGEVALVRKLDTQHLYAMKTLRKSDVLRRKQVAHVKAERDILAEADNEWVVKLYYSFQDMDHLYFVMDYIPGGDLMSLLIKKGIFEESLARFYIAELTCAVESVHKMGFIHRDIKPDNILIDRDGHIKLTDFGLCTGFRWTHNSKYYQDSSSCCCPEEATWQICTCAYDDKPLERRRKTGVRCLAHSLVGTPNYIAPEVLLRTGYTQLCDWWSVGVILYEMLVGQPPFLAPTPAETQYKVINWASTLRIPSQQGVSPNAQDLILQLCTDHSTIRLGMKGAPQVKAHPFFASVEFEAGLRRTVAPYIPKIRHPTDTSNFDPGDDIDKLDECDVGPWESNQFHGFFEFTFRRFFDDAYNEEGGPVYV